MAWYSGIVNKAKDVYKKVDNKLGGYLPGGQTPKQVSTSRLPTPIVTTPTPRVTTPTPRVSTPTPSKTSPTGYVDKSGQPISYAPQLPKPAPSPFQQQPSQPTGQPQTPLDNTQNEPVNPITPTIQSGTTTNAINPTTGNPYTEAEAPYGTWEVNGVVKPVTQAESGQASAVTANDIMDLGMLASGVFGLGKLAIKGISTALARRSAGLLAERAILENVGKTALQTGGNELLASTIPEASGVVAKKVIAAGTPAVNTVTKAGILKTITNAINTKMPGKNSALGWSIAAALGGVLYSARGQAESESQATTYLKNSGNHQRELRESGLFAAAEELHQQDLDVLQGISTWKGFIPLFGPGIEKKVIEDAERILNANISEYEAYATQQEADLKAQEALDKRTQELQDAETKRTQELQDRADQRTYDESRLQEQRAYNEQQAALKAQQQAGFDATATESTGGSVLNFGILNSGGDIEYVDINRASQYYFGIPYEKLTPEQRKLLMLGKGTL